MRGWQHCNSIIDRSGQLGCYLRTAVRDSKKSAKLPSFPAPEKKRFWTAGVLQQAAGRRGGMIGKSSA
jgi:hypothetical protein